MKNLKILLLLLILAAPVFAAEITDGNQVIAAMHKKYEGNWYKTLTFVQKNTEYKADGTTQNSIWYEAMSAPGNLRIDFDPVDSRSGLMFADSMQHSFKDGKLVRSQPTIHPLMVLGFDVYLQSVEKTVSQLKGLNIDLSVLREDVWQNRPVYVVGAKATDDLKSPQFWIDKENLYFVRMLQPAGKNKDHTSETQFNKYLKVKGGWIAPEVVFMTDGKRTFLEEYTDIKTDVALDTKLFDAGSWASVERPYLQKDALPEFLEQNGYIRIPLSKNATGHFYTGGSLNGRAITVLVDSGAAYTVVNHELAKEMNLSLTKLAKHGGGAGAAKLDLYQIGEAQFEVGNFKPKALALLTMDLTNVNQSLKLNGASPVDVILGADVFEAHKAVIDYTSRALYLKL